MQARADIVALTTSPKELWRQVSSNNPNERLNRSEAGWLQFIRGLTARGLSGVSLVTSNAHAGLVAAVGATLPAASWQRRRTRYDSGGRLPTEVFAGANLTQAAGDPN